LKNRKTILLVAIAAFWVAYVGIVSAEYYFNITSRVDRVIKDRKKDVDFVLEFSGNLIIKDNIDSLSERLKQAQEFRMVDFYILQKKNKVITFYNKQNNPDELNQEYSKLNQFIESEDVTFKTIQIYDYHLTVGVNTAKKSLSRVAFGEQKYLMLHNLAVVSIFAAVLFFFIYRNALSLTKLRGIRKLEPAVHLKSVIAATLNESQKNFLAPALLHELKSNTFAPSSFESTLVRVDLNHETQAAISMSDHLSAVLNRYIIAAQELVGRYGGLLCQNTGTELVFHFKGSRNVAEPMAVACVRSLFELAEEMERTLPTSAGKTFKLKASLSSGQVHFTKLESGLTLSGVPFTESAKILGQDSKVLNRSVLAFPDSCREFVLPICKASSLTSDLCVVDEFVSQERMFEKGEIEYSTFYRSDLNLMALMKYMEKLVDEQNGEFCFRIFGDLKHVKANIICSDLEISFTRFLEFAYRKSHDKPVDPKILSAAVSLTHNLIPPGSGSEKLTEILKLYLQFSDPRVQANAVLILGEVPSNIRFLKKFIHSDHNRLSADALLVTGKQVVDKELLTRVQSLLRSSNKVHQASGRYVALKLVEHHKQNDLLYYNTNPHLKKLEALLGKAA
jgi:adenylate cyclase